MMDEFFFFFFGELEKKKKIPVDYEALYERLKKGPISFQEIQDLTGVSHSGVAQVVTTLSLRYTLWSPQRGIYKLLEESDFEAKEWPED